MATSWTAPWRAARWAALALPLALVACDDVDFAAALGPGNQVGGPFGQRPAALVGRWSRFDTSPGVVSAGVVTQTTWQFFGDLTARRTITTRTSLGAVLETNVIDVVWRATPGVLTLEFGAPSFRIVTVSYQIDYGVTATTLFLDGVPYQRSG